MDSPWLGPLVVGALLSIASGFVSQWYSERRAVAREQRDRAHEKRTWSREQQRDAYAAFLTAYTRNYRRMIESASENPDRPLYPSVEMDEALAHVDIFGSRTASDKAQELYNDLIRVARMQAKGLQSLYATLEIKREFTKQVRLELGLDQEGAELPNPPPNRS